MRGQAKRFVNQDGDSYDVEMKPPKKLGSNVGFFGLWRYATAPEKALTSLGVVISWFSSAGLIAAVVIYGELTALFVARHRAVESTGQARILTWFGGGRDVPAGNRSMHMDALVEDSIAFAWASVAVMLVQFTAAAIAVTLANTAASTMISRVRWRLLATVIRQEAGFFDTNTTMNFAATLTEDMDKVRSGVGEHVVMTSYLCGTVCLGAGLSLAYGWSLTLAALSVVPLAVATATTVAKYQTKCSNAEVMLYGAAGRVVEEALANIRTVRAYGGEHLEVDRYVSALKPAARQSVRRGILAGAGAGAGWMLTYAINAIVFGYGAILVVRDMDLPSEMQEYHPGVMLTILFCSFMAAQNIAMCHPHLEVFSAARGAAKNLYKLLERKSKIDALLDKGDKPNKFRGDIEFKDVYFNYPSRPDVKVLRGLNLSIKAGETVALVGGSGCGKSTALQLLQRLYEPDAGTVTVDGRPLTALHLHHYRSSIGVVGQEPVLFSGTIRDNISIGRDDVTLDDVIIAAKTAHAHQFITKLTDGYDTVLGERGAQLSGGQKQRIAIARAVLRQPALLLLDEPTSALDAAAEGYVQRALDAAAKGRTTLVVSHRLSTIVNASRIVYMSQGAVLEQGTHSELLAARGAYWTLVQEDLTNKSISNALSSIADVDDDDVVLPSPTAAEAAPLHRDFLRRSSKAFRGSRRLGSVSSARGAMLPAHDTDVLTEDVLSECDADSCDIPPVSWIQILRLNAPEWALLCGGGLASFCIGLTMPIFALLFSKFYGMFATSSQSEILSQSAIYAGMFGGVAALCGIVTAAQTWMFNAAGAKLTDRLRELTFSNYLKQEQGWFDLSRNSVGALCARLATDCAAVQGATGTRLGTVLQGVSTLVIGVGLALAYSWNMTLVSLCSVPFVIGGIYLEGWVTKRTEIAETKALEHASKVATEAVLNVRTVQSLGIEHELLSRYQLALSSNGTTSTLSRLTRGAVYGLCLSAPTLGYAVSLAYGGYLIAREGLPLENAILVSEALVYGAWMLAEALSFAPSFAAAARSAARILHALDRKPKVYTHTDARITHGWQPAGSITFSDIHFKYPTRPHVSVLRGLNLSLHSGCTVALVGASGCGKSTLIQLLMRSYDADQGIVKMDDVDITRDVSVSELRSQFGLVQQEPALFARSLRDNIAYGDNTRQVPLEEIIEAAKQANIHNFIASLPNGYDTELGGVGAALSGGQKQRVCIARALVRRPRVLLLDEATSALDASSEKVVQAALEKASEGRTTIIIAHRLATIQHAHNICVIDKGVVCEQGTHDELVRLRGKYWDLLQQQGSQHAEMS